LNVCQTIIFLIFVAVCINPEKCYFEFFFAIYKIFVGFEIFCGIFWWHKVFTDFECLRPFFADFWLILRWFVNVFVDFFSFFLNFQDNFIFVNFHFWKIQLCITVKFLPELSSTFGTEEQGPMLCNRIGHSAESN